MGSTISALLAKENGLRFDCIFADTLIESKWLYEGLDQLEKAIGQPIYKVKDGRDPWDVFVDKRYIGNTRTAHCSTELKTVPVRNWIYKTSTPNDILVLGMDWTEQDRIERAQERWHIPVTSLLNKFNCPRYEWDGILARYGLKKSLMYKLGFLHDNCGGFCVKAGLAQFKMLLLNFPEIYAYHERRMNEVLAAIPTARPFLRKTIDGEKRYLTLTQFREMIEDESINIDAFDMGGCGCFTD